MTNFIPSEYGGRRFSAVRVGVHLDEVIEGEQAERQPHRRGRLDTDFQKRVSRQSERNQDLEVHIIVGSKLNLPVETLAEIDDRAGGARVLRQELGFPFNLLVQLVDLGDTQAAHLDMIASVFEKLVVDIF